MFNKRSINYIQSRFFNEKKNASDYITIFLCSSNLTTLGFKIKSPKFRMTVRVKVVSLLSVKHQQFCWKTNWKLISGVGHGAGSFSKPAVWLPKQKQHSYLKSSVLLQLLI